MSLFTWKVYFQSRATFQTNKEGADSVYRFAWLQTLFSYTDRKTYNTNLGKRIALWYTHLVPLVLRQRSEKWEGGLTQSSYDGNMKCVQNFRGTTNRHNISKWKTELIMGHNNKDISETRRGRPWVMTLPMGASDDPSQGFWNVGLFSDLTRLSDNKVNII